MALTILDDRISSSRTTHSARAVTSKDWEVSWLAGRYVDRNSAITAMVLADALGPAGLPPSDPLWIHIGGWAQELGLDVPEVRACTASQPAWTALEQIAELADPEAAE